MLLCSTCCANALAELQATVRLGTGELRLRNENVDPFHLTAYQVLSPSEDLDVDAWLPIAGRLDGSVTGDMSFDDEEWIVVAPTMPIPAVSDELVEGVVLGDGGTLGFLSSIYLGPVWDVTSSRSLDIQVSSNADEPTSISVMYVPTGDYNEDGIVNFLDYFVWKSEFGTRGPGVLSDGNADGVVNLADYTLWRDNLGATALPSQPVQPLQVTTLSIPEPTAWRIIAMLSLLAGATWRMR